MSESPLDRRAFLRESVRGLFRTVAKTVDAVSARESTARPDRGRLRPPGALPEGSFLSACTQCGDCIEVCPAQCITLVPEGFPDQGTPEIVPALRACVLCTDLACTQVCEPGALEPLGNPAMVHMGMAWLDPGSCQAYQGGECTLCHDVCPTEPKAIALDGRRPRVQADLCTGCGLCEERCPTAPKAIQIAAPGWPNPFMTGEAYAPSEPARPAISEEVGLYPIDGE